MKEFLDEVLARKRVKPSHMASALHISHATVSRWMTGEDIPSISSCKKLAEYAGVSVEEILAVTGHLKSAGSSGPDNWPSFREYATKKYPEQLDDDLITMIEDLIERRKSRGIKTDGGI